MSGHSKWATTKHRKAAVDAKRSKLFSKLSRIITVAAKTGGDPNPANNAPLAAAIEKARGYSLPKDRIQAAVDKAFGSGEGADFVEIIYEGYGPCGVAFYVESLTDNRNRTAADVRALFTRAGGNLGATGSVGFLFERVGEIPVSKSSVADEEELLLQIADAGGEDLEDAGDDLVVITAPGDLMSVKRALESAGVTTNGADLTMRAKTETDLGIGDARKVMRLVDGLEDLDDVQEVYHNMAMTEELQAALDE
jgi:YebC/PmpR family DNA-binding regulatory protein